MVYRANQEDTQRPLMPQQTHVNLTSLLSANNPLNGEASGSKEKWPFILRVTKLNTSSGKIMGQIEFTTLSSTIKIEGILSKTALIFKTTDYIKKGDAVNGVIYTLYPDTKGKLKGHWIYGKRQGDARLDIGSGI